MKIDTQEIQALEAAQAPRFDMYGPIHKALRALMADTLVDLGRLDTQDAAEVARVAARVGELLAFCASHVQHENEHVHPAVEACAAASSAAVAHDHDEHLQHIAQLSQAAQALGSSPAAARAAAAHRLYGALALFIADNLHHMQVEETAHNAVLWAHRTDAELLAVHDALVASIPPQEMMFVARWMLPHVNAQERLAIVADMRAKAPPPAFEAVLDIARQHLRPADWTALARGLGLAPAPGLVA